MRMATGLIMSFIMMILVFLVGFIIIGQVVSSANSTGTLNGTAATQWTNFVNYMWLGVSLLAFTPLIMVIVVFAGLFGAFGGGGGGGKRGG